MKNIAVFALLLFPVAAVLAHPGHSPAGTVNHEMEHGVWLAAALVLAVSAGGYRWLRNR